MYIYINDNQCSFSLPQTSLSSTSETKPSSKPSARTEELIGMLPPVVGGGLSLLFNESLGFLPAEHLRHIKFLAAAATEKDGKVER